MLPTVPEMPRARRPGSACSRRSPPPTCPRWCSGPTSDPILTLETGHRFAAAIGAPEPEVVENASHFLQEDAGEEIGRRIAAWLDEQGA